MAQQRLQKVLAQAGIASRRGAEKYITDGRVRVNGKIVTELGVKVDDHLDKVEVDGRRLVRDSPVYYILNKPREVVSTLSDPEGRSSLADIIEKIPERVFPVGRLDYHTSGALLLTNDGEFSEALLRPSVGVPKVYAAKLQGHVDVPELDALRNGVKLDDGYVTKKADVFVLRTEDRCTWVQITLREGKNRQIHRMGDAIGHRVQRLTRLAFAGVDTEGLRPGQQRALSKKELDTINKLFVAPFKKKKREGGAGTGQYVPRDHDHDHDDELVDDGDY
ncbi:MAG: rRNA pseudouridine synthase [Sandaracinaceae bacterium]|jgi:23S rRNA pseudouridine2605 synthase|nr:rRNA pseudouridine synthase [Sandaracinaceae bacterium]MBK6808101.1 rRNA pseudouridine synthase [Sandaracinaceae bacterium]MBK7151002.1 rRNA pseudouridine synthase [Sandaracinaceae bacterium]MBK8407336.1 rRNA pseudouridine synthase [Sandaracinaceae bacterium]MBK8592144.1 rRNA pseudouridine synthase [Sandaracinaceae bacterium]